MPVFALSNFNERDISIGTSDANKAKLTDLVPPSSCDYIGISFLSDTSVSLQGWSPLSLIPYDKWNAFTAVAADVVFETDNRWAIARERSSQDIVALVGKGTNGVLAVGARRADNGIYRFSRIGVIWVTEGAVGNDVIVSEADEPTKMLLDTDNMVAIDPASGETKTLSVPRIRTVMQQGIQAGTDPAAVNALIAAALAAYTPPADGGKLDIDLDNVDQTMSALDRERFANRVGLLKNTLDNTANTGLISMATRDSFRTLIHAQRAAQVWPDSTSIGVVTVRAGEIVYFTDITQHYANISGQTQMIQLRLIPTSNLFTRAHLPRATNAELIAGSGDDQRGFTPQDIVTMINTHASPDYADLSDRPFIVVQPGGALPEPTSSNERYLVVAGTAQGRIIYHQSVTHGVGLSVTYRSFNSSDLSSGNYRGEVNYVENLPSDANNGDVYFVRNDHGLRIWNDSASEWGNVFWTAGEWIGSFHSKSAADQAVAAHYPSGSSGTPVGKHLSYGGSLSTQDLYTVTAYTPDTVDVRTWKPIFGPGVSPTGGITEAQAAVLIQNAIDALDIEDLLDDVDDYDDNASQVLIQDEGEQHWVEWAEFFSDLGITVPINRGGTGATTVAGAKANLGISDAGVTEARVNELIDEDVEARIQTDTTVPAGSGGKVPTISVADVRYANVSGDTFAGALRAASFRGTGGGNTISQFGSAAAEDVGTASGDLAALESNGNFHPRRLANNSPGALADGVQFLSNNTATTARWRDLEGYVEDFAGALLAALSEFSYDTTTNTLSFNGGEFREHYQGEYDADTTYVQGDIVEYDDNEWFAHDAALANANDPGDPVATTGWSRWSGRSDWRGVYDEDDTTEYAFITGDRVSIRGDHTYFLTGPSGDYSPAFIAGYNQNQSVSWAIQLRTADVSLGVIQAAINDGSGPPTAGQHNFLVWEPHPENRIEYHTEEQTREDLGLDTALLSFAVATDNEGIEFTRADGNKEELTRANLKTALGAPTMPVQSSDPASPAIGQYYFNNSSNRLRVWSGTAWHNI